MIATEALLAIVGLTGIGAIVILPSFSATVATALPEYEALRSPLLTIAILFIIVGLVAVAMSALLVHRIYRGTMLTHRSVVWVNILIAATAFAILLIIAAFVVISTGQAGSPFIAAIQAFTCLVLITTACITLVLRSLLRNAIMIRAELDGVV